MKSFFYLDANQQQQGPVDASQLTSCGVTGDTYVWCKVCPTGLWLSKCPNWHPSSVSRRWAICQVGLVASSSPMAILAI